MTSTVNVYVSVYDPSESAVVFDQPEYTKSLPEDASLNTKVFAVRASKGGSNAGIKYELVGGHTDQVTGKTVFKIDASGQVLLNAALDRETTSSYTIYIRATHSGGSVEMATDVKGVVTVTDLNDDSPKFAFEGSSKIVTINSYTPSKALVIKVSVLGFLCVLLCVKKQRQKRGNVVTRNKMFLTWKHHGNVRMNDVAGTL